MAIPIAALIALFLAAALVRELWLFACLPGAAQALVLRGERERARRLLERLAGRRSLFGPRTLTDIRYRLAWLYLEKGEHQAAIAHCREALSHRLHPAVDSAVRRRLADCLEAAGDVEAARAERETASRSADAAPDAPSRLIAQARTLANQHRWSEACDLYEQAVPLIPAWNDAGRAEVRVRLALASFEAGRHERSAHWAEEALALKPRTSLLMNAHAAAGLAYSALGDLARSEEHRMKACGLAASVGSKDSCARYLAHLATVQMNRGKIVEAVDTCEKAAGMSMTARRMARMTEAECMRLWGRFDEARRMLEQCRKAPGFPTPAAERRSQAVVSLALAWVEAEAGRPEEARAHLDHAAPELECEEKLGLWFDATAAWVDAQLGRGEEARQRMARVETDLAGGLRDRGTRLTCCARLADAAFALGDYAHSRDLVRRGRDAIPYPADLPRSYYREGECCLLLEDPEGAEAAFREAVAVGVDVHFARLAQQKLEGMAAEAATGPPASPPG